jgi:hypothetical protein
MPLSNNISAISLAVSFIGGRNQSARRKPDTERYEQIKKKGNKNNVKIKEKKNDIAMLKDPFCVFFFCLYFTQFDVVEKVNGSLSYTMWFV